MDKQTFINKFQLQPLMPNSHKFRFGKPTREAAVLIPIVDVENELHIVLTRRSEQLKHHAGQISFPGGKVEPSDPSLVFTALREAEEEIGLPMSSVQTIGQLEPYHTISGFNVTPIVGMLTELIEFKVDMDEVASVFTVPLSHFLDQENHIKVDTYHHGYLHQIHFMPYQDYNIWGATAAMLADLVRHIKD